MTTKTLNGGTRKKGQGSNWIRRNKRLAIYRRDNHRCIYCNRDLANEVATLDHLQAVELGGSNHESNLVTCCSSCNSSKQDLPLRKFLSTLSDQGIDVDRVRRIIRRNTRRSLASYK